MAEGTSNWSDSCERSRISLKLAIASAVFSLIFAVLAYVTGMVSGWSGIGAFTLSVIPFTVALLFSIAAAVYAMLAGNASEEEYEKAMLQKRKESSTSILDVGEDVRFTAGRTFSNYRKYAPAVFCILGFLIVGGGLWWAWSKNTALLETGLPLPKDPIALAFTCVVGAVLALMAAMFMAGQSRIAEFRWLRPAAAWIAAGAGTWILAAIPAIALKYEYTGLEKTFAKIVFGILVLLGIEFIVSFITEFYRPRTQIEDRPVYESRLLALFIDPGNVAKNIADSLDYQFGFKVSGTWLYQKFCSVALPFVFFWLVILWFSTCICEIGPGCLGVKTSFGEMTEMGLKPGFYLKYPWPLEDIKSVRVDQPRQVVIGVTASKDSLDPAKQKPKSTILWTEAHQEGETPFLVANNSESKEIGTAVSMLYANLPVIYKVKGGPCAIQHLVDYLSNYENVPTLLADIGTREASIYFASTDFTRDMSVGREEISKELRKRLQKAVDEAGCGIEILAVNFTGTHPPIENVAAEFQNVFVARENMDSEIQKAKSYSTTTAADAAVAKMTLLADANAYTYNITNVSASEANRFRSQLSAYKAMPGMFKLRTYLEFLEVDCAPLRKYIVSETIPYQILELNAEEKARLDLMDADLTGTLK